MFHIFLQYILIIPPNTIFFQCPLGPYSTSRYLISFYVINNLLSVLNARTCGHWLGHELPVAISPKERPSLSQKPPWLPVAPLLGVGPRGPSPSVLGFTLASSCAGHHCCYYNSHIMSRNQHFTASLPIRGSCILSTRFSSMFPEPWVQEVDVDNSATAENSVT